MQLFSALNWRSKRERLSCSYSRPLAGGRKGKGGLAVILGLSRAVDEMLRARMQLFPARSLAADEG